MLVTLPCLLLVLDFWPLRRWAAGDKSLLGDKNAGAPSFSLGWLLLEKAPLLVLSAASSAATLWAQREGGAVKSLAQLPLSGRLANAAVSYLEYLRQMVLPVNLAAFYPHAGSELAPGQLWASILLLLAATILVLLCRRPFPYLTVGWLWYLGTLVPAIGLVQVGSQARADRYTYFPLVGIFLMLTWGVADLAVRWRRQRLAACAAALLLAYCMTASWLQVHNWQDSVTLWSHALEVTSESFVTHNNLGQALLEEGQVAQAAAHFDAALRLNPASTLAHYNRGFCYHLSGQLPEAIRHYREALRLDRNYVPAHSNLANALLLTGQPDEAVLHYREAVRLNPSNPRVHAGLGSALLRQGMLAEAVIHFQDALRLDPSLDDTYRDLGLALQLQEDWPQAADGFRHALDLRPENSEYHRSLAYCLERMGQTESARAEYQESLRLDPAWPQTVLREAWELATHTDTQRRNGRLAVQRAEQVLQGTGQRDPHTLDTLAAACAEAGQFTVAVATAREALAQAVAGSQTNLVKEIEQRLALYQKVQPFHAASP